MPKLNKYVTGTDSAALGYKWGLYDPNTQQSKFFSDYYVPLSFTAAPFSVLNNKILVQVVLKDTMTGVASLVNYRSHIAIMDMDGSNIRQVMIPE